MARINAFLKLGREQGCTDIHFAVGTPPLLRLLGDLAPIKYRALTAEELESLVFEILNDKQRAEFEAGQDLDFSYQGDDVGRFRVSLFRKIGGIGAAFRVIPPAILTLDDLELPPVVARFLDANQGLILVTGATGTGKSTTLTAMLDLLNKSRRLNIITLEDPIEQIHKSQLSLVVQREVGTHVESFAEGLRAALREDPDVILVGELRDPETIMMAMTAAETRQDPGPHHRRHAHLTEDPGQPVPGPAPARRRQPKAGQERRWAFTQGHRGNLRQHPGHR